MTDCIFKYKSAAGNIIPAALLYRKTSHPEIRTPDIYMKAPPLIREVFISVLQNKFTYSPEDG